MRCEAVLTLLPPGSVAEVVSPDAVDEDQVTERELAVVAGAVEKRRREFIAGRAAARCALAELDVSDFDLLPGEDRAPIWPDGIVGSISHTEEQCVVVVVRSTEARSVGVDIEPDEPLEQDLWNEICTPNESAWIAQQDPGRRARFLFSAKEAIYKCQRPITGRFLEFHEVEVEVAGGGFFWRQGPEGIEGASAHVNGHIVTVALWL